MTTILFILTMLDSIALYYPRYLKHSNHSFKERKTLMSVTTQAFTYAINHIESLMTQAATETKKAINSGVYAECDYFVITIELTPSGFIPNISDESDKFDAMCYDPNVVGIFVDEASKFLSWENPTKDDIESFKNILIAKRQQAQDCDSDADRLAESPQTQNILITNEDLGQPTLAFLKKHNINPDTFVETLVDNVSFNKDSHFKDINRYYFKELLNQPFKYLATAFSDKNTLMLNDIFESKNIRFSFEALEQAPNEPTTTALSIDDKTITWAEMKNIILTNKDSDEPSNKTLYDYLEEIGVMPKDQSTEPSIIAKLFINYNLNANGIKPVFTNTTNYQQLVKKRITNDVRNIINNYGINRMDNDKTTIALMAKNGDFTVPTDDKQPHLLAVTIETPNGSKQCSTINLNTIMQSVISEPEITDALYHAIEKALIKAWARDMAHFNPIASYINQCINDGILKAPEHRHTLETLAEDQCYFERKAKQLKNALEK